MVEISMRDRGLAGCARALHGKGRVPGAMATSRPRHVRERQGCSSTIALRQERRRAWFVRWHARFALTGLTLRARRAAELRTVAAREMRRRLEAAGGGDIDDRHRGLQQQLARAAQAHLQVVALGHAVQMALEQALDLTPRESGGGGDLIE